MDNIYNKKKEYSQPLDLAAKIFSELHIPAQKDACDLAEEIIKADSRLRELLTKYGDLINKRAKITGKIWSGIPEVVVYGTVKSLGSIENGAGGFVYTFIYCRDNKIYRDGVLFKSCPDLLGFYLSRIKNIEVLK